MYVDSCNIISLLFCKTCPALPFEYRGWKISIRILIKKVSIERTMKNIMEFYGLNIVLDETDQGMEIHSLVLNNYLMIFLTWIPSDVGNVSRHYADIYQKSV